MTETEIVERFLAALDRRDVDAALKFVDPAIVYQNVPLPPARGLRAFERQMRLIESPFDHFEARIDHVAQSGPVVLTQRTDVLGLAGRRISFWVCGTFRVEGGRIVLWRDHFDWVQVLLRTAVALPAVVLRAAWRVARR